MSSTEHENLRVEGDEPEESIGGELAAAGDHIDRAIELMEEMAARLTRDLQFVDRHQVDAMRRDLMVLGRRLAEITEAF